MSLEACPESWCVPIGVVAITVGALLAAIAGNAACKRVDAQRAQQRRDERRRLLLEREQQHAEHDPEDAAVRDPYVPPAAVDQQDGEQVKQQQDLQKQVEQEEVQQPESSIVQV